MTADLKIDSGILQFAPKGSYYEEKDQQIQSMVNLWKALFKFDRTMFCLLTLLNGTGFSKGAMSHMLLSNPQPLNLHALIPQGLAIDYEEKVILYNLYKEEMPRALKNLLMLTGRDGFPRVNNTKTKRIILEFIFKREADDLDDLAVNFKGHLRALVRHALGKYELHKIFNGDKKLFKKRIGKINPNALPVLYHLFDKPFQGAGTQVYFKKIDLYKQLKEAAQSGDIEKFKSIMEELPWRTVIGFRNKYKLPVEMKTVLTKSKVGKRDSLQMQSAAKKAGATVMIYGKFYIKKFL
jgi:hypothetical protein